MKEYLENVPSEGKEILPTKQREKNWEISRKISQNLPKNVTYNGKVGKSCLRQKNDVKEYIQEL